MKRYLPLTIINALPGILPRSPIRFMYILLALSLFGGYSIAVLAQAPTISLTNSDTYVCRGQTTVFLYYTATNNPNQYSISCGGLVNVPQ